MECEAASMFGTSARLPGRGSAGGELTGGACGGWASVSSMSYSTEAECA